MTDEHRDTDTNPQRTAKPDISRREFVSRAGITGISTFGLYSAGAGARLADDSREIVVVRHGDEPKATREVPQQWYSEVLRSRRVTDAIREKFGDEEWLVGVQRPPTSDTVGGMAVPGVTAKATDVATARRKLPDTVEGVDINVEKGDEPEPASWCNTTSYNCVHGGSFLKVEDYAGDIVWHSAGTLAYYNGNPYLMTCSHGFNGDTCSYDISNNTVWQGSQYVGNVATWDYSQDWALVAEAGGSEIAGFSNTILYSGGYPIYGYTTRDGIDYVTSNNITLYKYGARTCETTGTSNGEHWWTKCYDDEPWVHTTNNIEKGDSGSPNYWYYEENGQTYLAIIGTLYGWSNSGEAVWPASWKVYDDHGITFGGTPTC